MATFGGKSPEESANLISRVFLWWIITTLRKINRQGLKDETSFPLREDRKCLNIGKLLKASWDISLKAKRPSLLKAMFRVFGKKYIMIGVIYFLKEGAIQIALCLTLGKFIQVYDASDRLEVVYVSLVFVLLSIAFTFIHVHWYLSSVELGCNIASGMTVLIFYKLFRVNLASIQSSEAVSPANLISSDMKCFELPIGLIHSIWLGPLMFVTSGAILWISYGPETIVGFITMFVLTALSGMIGTLYLALRRRTAICSDGRLSLMDHIIAEIRVIKTNAWENLLLKSVTEKRNLELGTLKERARINSAFFHIGNIYSRLIVFSTLLVYVFTHNSITTEKVFVTMSFYSVVSGILSSKLLPALVNLTDIKVATRRMQEFLLLPEYSPNSVQHLNGNPAPFQTVGKVDILNYSGTWETAAPLALKKIQLHASAGKPVFILGPVGSGKSTMFNAILGELITVGGGIITEGRFGFVAQSPWAFYGTIRENILFGKPMEPKFYYAVLDATALIQDMNRFPEGDSTLVGDKGSTLSGGQKSRINLARALYADADIYLLDDVLSAVDYKVGQEIWSKAIQRMLKEKCLIVATNYVQFIAHDSLVVLMENGIIKASGMRFQIQQTHPKMFQQTVEFKTESKPMTNGKQEENDKDINSIGEQSIDESSPLINQTENSAEVIRTGLIGMRICWRYIRAGNSVTVAFFTLILLIISQGCLSASDIILTKWTNSEDASMASSATLYMRLYGGLIVLDIFVGVIANLIFFRAGISSCKKLHEGALKGFLNAPLAFFEQNPSGNIMNRFSKDTSNVDEVLILMLFYALTGILQVLGVIVVACVLNPMLILPSIIVCYLFYSTRKFYLVAASEVKRNEAIARSPVFSLFNTTMDGIGTIRALRQEKYMLQSFCTLKDAHIRIFYINIFIYTAFVYILSTLILAFQIIIVVIFVTLISDKAAASLILISVISMSQILISIAAYLTTLESCLVSAERVADYANLKPDGGDSSGVLQWRNPGGSDIRVENLVVQYGQKNIGLNNVSFHIQPGEKVGIVGRTGAGKSSLISALLRLVEPSAGLILIDGVDIRTISVRSLRKGIAVISQSPGFLKGNLRMNLDPFDEHSDEEVWSILELLQLSTKVAQDAQGFNQSIDFGGGNFSQGERQLIALGRVLLSRKKIVIMDEASSKLDFQTDQIIQNIIRVQLRGVTVIAIAHRWETIQNFDRILMLENGEVLLFDTPQKVLNKQGFATIMQN